MRISKERAPKPGRKTYLEAVIVGLLKEQIEDLMRGTHDLQPTEALNEERKLA